MKTWWSQDRVPYIEYINTSCIPQALRRDQEGGEKFGYIVFWKLAGEKRAIPKQVSIHTVAGPLRPGISCMLLLRSPCYFNYFQYDSSYKGNIWPTNNKYDMCGCM